MKLFKDTLKSKKMKLVSEEMISGLPKSPSMEIPAEMAIDKASEGSSDGESRQPDLEGNENLLTNISRE